MIVRYETQQVHCIRNAKGEITEGSESEVFHSFLYDDKGFRCDASMSMKDLY